MSEPAKNAGGRALRVLAFVVSAILVVAIVVALWPRAKPALEPVAVKAAEPPLPRIKAADLPAVGAAWTPAPTASIEPPAPESPPVPMDRVSFNKRHAEVTQRELDDVNTWIKYPLWSQPLTENMMWKPVVPYHSTHPGPNGANPTLEIFTDKVSYQPGDAITVFAIARGDGGPVGFDALTGHTMSGNDAKPLPQIDFQWNDMPDHAGSMATFTIPPDVARANRGEWGINVDCQIQAQHRVGHTLFMIAATDATVTGPYRLAVENGSLSVYVGITGTAPSRQHLKGELWGPHGEPIAYAWVRNDDTPVGPSTLKLVFYGKTIRDSAADGPYTVKNLLLTTFDTDNSRIVNDPVDPSLVTPPFKRTIFTDVPINGDNANLQAKKDVYESELKMAQQNGYDPNKPALPPPMHVNKGAAPPQ